MATFNVRWNTFTVHKKHDIDRDKPYLWVFGIVVDVTRLGTKQFVIRRRSDSDNLAKKFGKGDTSTVPSDLDLDVDVSPIGDLVVGGVVVVAWENAMTKDSVIADAYDAAADAINDFIKDRLESPNALEPLSEDDLVALKAGIEADVRSTIKDGWTIFQLLPDHEIGSGEAVEFYDASSSQALSFRFKKGSTDYQLEGTMSYTATTSGSGGRPSSPPQPPGKVLQSPKPQSELGVR
jgi:hypothetical protein